MTQTDCINFLLYFACEDQAVSDRFWNEKSTKKKKKKKTKTLEPGKILEFPCSVLLNKQHATMKECVC